MVRIIIFKKRLEDKYSGKVYGGYASPDGGGYPDPFREQFIKYMDDDFNTPRALSILFDMINKCNKILDANKDHDGNIELPYVLDTLDKIADIFGLNLLGNLLTEISDEEIIHKINDRKRHKIEKRFKEADEIRKFLADEKFILGVCNGFQMLVKMGLLPNIAGNMA